MDAELAPGTQLGPYEIEALIGVGGMGRVYRARDPRLGRMVAIKTLSSSAIADPDVVKRFETEARTVGTLHHPNLLTVYDVGRADDVPFLVSELLDGETLRDRLRRKGALTERESLDFGAQIVRGLVAAHAQGIVHRDLKPENLFLTHDRRLKILDFGIAKRLKIPGGSTPATTADSLTAAGAIVGTVGYMAPEQVLGEEVDARTDLFSLGVVLHEMLGGTAPFQRDTALATLTAIVGDDPAELSVRISPLLERVVRRCLEKSPDDRFQTSHDLGIALDLIGPTSSADRSSPAIRPPGITRRRVLAYGAASLGLIASGAGVGALIGGRQRGAVSPSFRRVTFRRGLIRSARVAPDGETILFGALWDGDRCRVHTARVDGTESSALDLPDANVLAISRSGELALLMGGHQLGVITYGTLARVPLSGGAPREMLEDVKFADWSPDGLQLAIVRRVDGRDRLEYPIGTVLVEPKPGEHTGIGFARVSPDGDHVAFVQYHAPDSLLGRVSAVDRSGRVTRLSEEFVNVHGLAWRRNEIWYTAADDRPLFRAVRAVPLGGGERTITRVPGNTTLWDTLPDGRLIMAQTDDRAVLVMRLPGASTDRDLSWLDASWIADVSRDGRLMLFTETGQGGGPQGSAYLRPTAGGPAVRLGTGQAYALSPDTRWALCAAPTVAVGAPSPSLEIIPTGAGEPRQLAAPGLAFTDARWLPEQNRIVASAVEGGGGVRLFRIDLTAGRPEALTPEGVSAWAVSPDGTTVAVVGVGEGIQLMAVDGSGASPLPSTSDREQLIGWIDDGVLVVRSDDSPGRVHVVDVRTGTQSFWANILPTDPVGIMALVAFRATPDGSTRAFSWHRALSNLYVAEGLA